METRRLPIGISDYKKMIDEGYYYVDKTDFIRQIIEEGALITLLPRVKTASWQPYFLLWKD